MDWQQITLIIIIIVSGLLITSVLMQPTKNTGFIGEVAEHEKLGKSSFERFLSRFTIVLAVLLFVLCLAWTYIPAAAA